MSGGVRASSRRSWVVVSPELVFVPSERVVLPSVFVLPPELFAAPPELVAVPPLLLGVAPRPSPRATEARARDAAEAFLRLHPKP